jgi:hypothetical protein
MRGATHLGVTKLRPMLLVKLCFETPFNRVMFHGNGNNSAATRWAKDKQ